MKHRKEFDTGDVLRDDAGNRAIVRAAYYSPSEGADLVLYRFQGEPLHIGALASEAGCVPDFEGSALTYSARLDRVRHHIGQGRIEQERGSAPA